MSSRLLHNEPRDQYLDERHLLEEFFHVPVRGLLDGLRNSHLNVWTCRRISVPSLLCTLRFGNLMAVDSIPYMTAALRSFSFACLLKGKGGKASSKKAIHLKSQSNYTEQYNKCLCHTGEAFAVRKEKDGKIDLYCYLKYLRTFQRYSTERTHLDDVVQEVIHTCNSANKTSPVRSRIKRENGG